MEENEKSRIYIEPEFTSEYFCYIYKSQDHHDHLEKWKGGIACGPK